MVKTNEMAKKKCNIYEVPKEYFVFKQPTEFSIENKNIETHSWVNLIDQLCGILMKQDKETFNDFLMDEKERRTRLAYLSKDEEDIHFSKYLEQSELYLNKKIDAPRSARLILKMLTKFKNNSFVLCVRDYNLEA